MLTDFAQARAPRTAQADVCIIGAGAAGITLARGLSGQGLRILLLESGGLDYGPESAALGVGENVGAAYYPLEDSRLRFFGGTTNIWGGRCAPLDHIDFQARDWVAHSGWPIDGGDLAEGYRAAHQDLGVGAPDSSAEEEGQWGAAGLSMDADRFMSRCWRFDTQRERFHAKRTQDVLKAPDIETLINATAVGIQAHPNRSGLDHVLVRHAGGQVAKIKANAYVLACGGIETPACCWLQTMSNRSASATATTKWGDSSWNTPTAALAASERAIPIASGTHSACASRKAAFPWHPSCCRHPPCSGNGAFSTPP